MDIVDAYTHCGITKYEPIEQVRRVMDAAGVNHAVLAQHLGEFDNTYIGGIVASDSEHFAGVCLVDHTRPDAASELKTIALSGHFKGIRLLADSIDSGIDCWKAAADLDFNIVLYAPDGLSSYIDALVTFLESSPECNVVLTHLGTPMLDQDPDFKEYGKVFQLADFGNLYYQVSGMKMFCPFPHAPLYSQLEQAAKTFGTSRLLWGSNYPVVGDQQDYLNDLRLLLDGKLPFPESTIADIAGGNARDLWFSGK
jgi:predicted TIM-barrel fold metal-dependent hydrolase